MRAVLQRVTEASVTIDGQKVGEIGKGIMVLFGMLGTDTDKTIDYMLDKVINLRIFEDENGKMKLCHTLNNTCVAPPRMLIAFLENNLQADGTVKIPEVLWPYMGGTKVLVPTKK